jgi:hypothetical protein
MGRTARVSSPYKRPPFEAFDLPKNHYGPVWVRRLGIGDAMPKPLKSGYF